ncbi:methyl-accepting chemotaxis protein [Geobacter sp. DSM 9736]|uniref:methyl-accepting chemotaxis protein n=1 Tax=Geobacter sp. DSM 9736 TaxID=1277350 RepID=UPI001E613373|nr:methyl-accepting chemotaxis protein [Geobacter sp. DSM 9736]
MELTDRKTLYSLLGLMLGVSAPVVWTVLRIIFFRDTSLSLSQLVYGDIVKDSYNIALYSYMGIGTALVMGFLGRRIGKVSDELHRRAAELDALHKEVASQKEIFENRYKVLDNNIKNFHQISSRIQKSINIREVLALCAEGLSEVLGYERVNILLVDDARENLLFTTSTGNEGFDTTGIQLPLDRRCGVIYKCFQERKVYLIEDISKCSSEFHLHPPFDSIKPLRSRNFVLCPIVVKGESVGVFGIDNKFSHRTLNDTDVDTVKLFADQAASAITRINLLQSIDTLTLELGKTFSGLLKNREFFSRNVFSLKSAVDSLSDNTTSIASASQSVMVSVDETSAAVAEILVAIEQVARNLDALSENVDKSVSAMEEINASIKNVEQNTVISHQISRRVREQADRGSAIVKETISALDEIQSSVDLSYRGIKRLSENSSRIEGIVSVINDITKRTNLLALNASIIAAQAGEYGKSFGVVADEIRNLSLQTGQSTGEITGIIEEIMGESKDAADTITLTKELVRRGVKLGQETGEALQVIVESSQNAMEMTEEINVATEEQAKSVQLVTRSIEDISTMTSQIFNASKEQSNSTKNIARAIDSIKEMTQEMVNATGRQVRDGNDIQKTVEALGSMIVGLFDDLEKRREESGEVVKELQTIKEIAG